MQQMVYLLQIQLLAQHVSGTIMPIIRSSAVLYRWLLPVVFDALVFKLSGWCRAEGCVSCLRNAAASLKLDTQNNSSSRDEIYEKNSRIYLGRLQNKYTNFKGIKNNTNSGQITGIQEELDTTCKENASQ